MPPDAALVTKALGGLGRTEIDRVRRVVGAQAWCLTWRSWRRRWWHRMCQWLCSSSSGQSEPTTCRVKRRCQLRCQCRCDQHDTQPNESPHCTFVATIVSAAATLGAIDEHVLLSCAARHGRACVRMAAVLVFVGLCIAHLTLATLPDRRLAAAPCHLALPAVRRAPARRVGTRVCSITFRRNFIWDSSRARA